jgi:hypothetical protein
MPGPSPPVRRPPDAVYRRSPAEAFRDRYGDWALIAGGSAGLGFAPSIVPGGFMRIATRVLGLLPRSAAVTVMQRASRDLQPKSQDC